MTDTINSTPTADAAQGAATDQETPAPLRVPESTGQAPGTPENAGGDEFTDADRAAMRKVIEKEREAAKAAKAEAERLREERATDRQRVTELEAGELRRGVASEKGLSPEQAELLTGETAEEMAAHADRLVAAFQPAAGGGLRRTPVERLRPGAVPSVEAQDFGQVADEVVKGW